MGRCAWASSEPETSYHDVEWGVPVHDDRLLFEMLTLEGAQAGLSWRTILAKREGYRIAFEGFEIERVASYTEADACRLLADPGIVRNRAKIAAAIGNARAVLEVRSCHGSFDAYLWSWVDGRPVQGGRGALSEIPARTELSDRISKDLLSRRFKFVGSTIVYAFLQAVGVVNDHTVDCFRHDVISRMR